MAARCVVGGLVVGEPTVGLWCERCALPSKVEFPVYAITEHGVSAVGSVPLCMEHGRDD